MHRAVVASMLIAICGCDSGNQTGPASALINVRVRDDVGMPVDRMPVRVTMSTEDPLVTRTGADGTVDVRVTEGGVYRVWVVPREGYLAGIESLSKTISVSVNDNATVDFIVHRATVSTDPRPFEPTW
jgi:hypothetical protein